eukprot:6176338-Pleurochrysis_carterae.AAC.1
MHTCIILRGLALAQISSTISKLPMYIAVLTLARAHHGSDLPQPLNLQSPARLSLLSLNFRMLIFT